MTDMNALAHGERETSRFEWNFESLFERKDARRRAPSHGQRDSRDTARL
jgi:hypothetical protein